VALISLRLSITARSLLPLARERLATRAWPDFNLSAVESNYVTRAVMKTKQAGLIIVIGIASVLALSGCMSDPNNLNRRMEIAPSDGASSYNPAPLKFAD
jgi:hypothetical protein